MGLQLNDAQIAEIQALSDENGYIDPQRVVDRAKQPTSELNKLFEWDVRAAAGKYWLSRASEIIKLVRLEIQIDRKIVVSPYYVSNPENLQGRKKEFVETTAIARDREMAISVILAEASRVAVAIRRMQALAKVLGLEEYASRLLQNLASLREAVEDAKKKKEEPPPKDGRKRKGKRRGDAPEARP